MARRKKIYEGKAKILYEGPEPGTIVQYFKDDATAFNAEKKDVIDGKGVLNNRLSEYFMVGLGQIGVPTHFLKRLNMREQLVRACEIVPLEVIVRNYAAGTMAKRLGMDEGTVLETAGLKVARSGTARVYTYSYPSEPSARPKAVLLNEGVACEAKSAQQAKLQKQSLPAAAATS